MQVEPPHRMKRSKLLGEKIRDGFPALGIALCGEHALWFMKKDHASMLLCGLRTIDLDVRGIGVDEAIGVRFNAPVNLDPA